MAKLGKLTKLKSAMKRLPTFTKLSRTSSSISTGSSSSFSSDIINDHNHKLVSSSSKDAAFHAVYVGKSRRRYYLSSDVICHPLLQELIDRSSSTAGYDGNYGEVVVANCEVVLFEHLLWMIECGGSNVTTASDDDDGRLGSMQELVGFYTC